MATTQTEKCGTCMYGAPKTVRLDRAPACFCRRYPPLKQVATGIAGRMPHPLVRADGWCGEYKSK